MKNITLRIDDETYRRARVLAAQEGTSVSAMVKDFLVSQVRVQEDRESSRVASLEALYRIAETRGQVADSPLAPLTREEIYDKGLR